MPKSTAIMLKKENIELISHELRVEEEKIVQHYVDNVLFQPGAEPCYVVKNPMLFYSTTPYLIYGRGEFLDNFASVPPGIEDRFVPVTQVKTDSN